MLENILARRSIDISVRERLAFVKYVLDKVVAIDDLIEVKNNRGQNIRIAIDVTTNYREEEEKLNKIRGLPELAEHQSSNRNKNIPLIRKQLGIDKHLILVLNNQIDKLPSHEKLLNDIYTFANDRSNTKSLNLFEVPEHERFIPDPSTQLKPQALWQTFSKGLARTSNPEISTQICIRAMRAGVSEANVIKMLEYDPQYRQLPADKARQYALLIYDRANDRLELQRNRALSQYQVNQRGLRALKVIIAHIGKNQANGDRVATGGSRVTMTQSGSNFRIERNDERGVILELRDKRLTGTLSIREMQTFEELASQFQALSV